jgi:DNA-binding NarL/FixJ family response regulator
VRIVIAEDAVLLRIGLVRVLEEAGEEIVAAVGDAPALVDAASRLRPDVSIVDIRLPPQMTDDGLRAAIELRTSDPEAAVLVFSQYVEEAYASELLATGTSGLGYLLKERVADVPQFLEAVRRVADGGTALDPEVVAQLVARSHHRDPLERLSPREREVLGLMAEGRSNQTIANLLVVSSGAVEKHVSNIFAKLDLPPNEPDDRRVLAVLRWLRL